MATVQKFTYADLLKRLEAIDPWLEKMGVPPKNDRVHFAIDVLRQAEEGTRKMRETGHVEKIGRIEDFLFGIVEALEMHDIFSTFENVDPGVLGPILKRALSGPARPTDENQNNADGRNIGFELALGAEWASKGAAVELAEPDLKLALEEKTWLVACKRPARDDSVRACIRAAATQLDNHLAKADERTFGVIAISLTRVLNPGDRFFSKEVERLGDALERQVRAHEADWKKADMNKRISIILFHIATPADWGEGLNRMTYTVVCPINETANETKVISQYLEQRYK